MGLFDDLFGGLDTSSQEATLNQNAAILEKQSQLSERARQDIANIFPSAQQAIGNATNKALDITGKSTREQINAFSQGNNAAKQFQAMGLSAFQDAILGNPQNLSADSLLGTLNSMQPIQVNTDFLTQTAPQVASPSALGLRLDPNVLDLPEIDRSINNGVGTDAQISAIEAIVNAFNSGQIGERQGAQQIANMANNQGLDLGQLSSIIGMTPDAILRVLSDNNARLDNTGDSRYAAVPSPTQPNVSVPQPTYTPTPTPTPDPSQQIADIAQQFYSGQISVGEGTRSIVNLANSMGLSASAVAGLVGASEAEVRQLAAQQGLSFSR